MDHLRPPEVIECLSEDQLMEFLGMMEIQVVEFLNGLLIMASSVSVYWERSGLGYCISEIPLVG